MNFTVTVLTGLDYMLEHNYKWFYRGDRDKFINVNALDEFISELDLMDHETPITKGGCVTGGIDRGKHVTLLQGGSGMIMSRGVAWSLLPHANTIIANQNKINDQYLSDVLVKYTGQTLKEMHDS